jgi:hypothetical protein
MTAETIPVLSDRLKSLEADHSFLEQIKQKGLQVKAAKDFWEGKKEESKDAKEKYEKLDNELQNMIVNGPPKPDPQRQLPFAEDVAADPPKPKKPVEAPAAAEAASPTAESTAPEGATVKIEIPPEIAALDLTELQKQRLAQTGAKTLADLVDLGNGNWPNYPNGFVDVDGFGPKAVKKLVDQLPSTAPSPPAEDSKQDGSDTVRVTLLGFTSNPNLQPGKEFEALRMPNGNVIIQLPGQDPEEFQPHEYQLVE